MTRPALPRPCSLPPAAGLAIALLFSPLAASALTLGVTEGVTYRASDAEIAAKFEPLAAYLSGALKQPVQVRVLSTYNALREATGKKELDIAFIHPAHVALEAVKTGNYSVAAWTSGFTEYRVSFLCKEPTPIKDWASIKTKKLVTPDPDSITAVMTRAMLRQQGLAPGAPQVLNTRYQDAVPFYVENTFAQYGATASKSVIKAWTDKGGQVCAQSQPVPIKQWIAANALPAATQAAVRAALLGAGDSDAGRKALAASGYKGFEAPTEGAEKQLTAWLGL
ncbi:ABC-type phosphate/phosphonate transport system, periplasmic component [Burkholderiales bacterium JOSHI_001]|nr:ABC-type phosphate/phosphonate transport system, periplasmic component [Burkholderiales bacterium JOSHI_001]